MKILFVPTSITTQHFETQLELMAQHLKAGDKVYVAKCRQYQQHCLLNTDYDWVYCIAQKARLNLGLSFLDRKKITEVVMPKIESIPKIPGEFDSLENLINFEVGGIGLGRGVATQLVTRHSKDPRLDTLAFKDEVSAELRNAYYVLLSFQKLVARVMPDLVYVFNGRFSTTRPIVDFCKKNEINFYTHEATTNYTRYCLYKNTIPHDLTYNASMLKEVWNNGASDKYEIGKNWFENRRKNVNQGFFSYTSGQLQGELPKNFIKKKKTVGIFNTSMEEYVSIPWFKNPIYKDDNDGLYRIFESFKNDQSVHFYLRVHPNLKNCNISQVQEIQGFANQYNNLTIILPEEKVHSYALMDMCDTVLTFGSTIGVEACYWGKPSILAGRSFYEFLDCTYKPKTHEDVVALLQADLEPKSKDDAIKYGYWETAKGIPFEYFKQTSMYGGGTFMGHHTNLHPATLIMLKSLRLLQRKTYYKLWKKFFRSLAHPTT